MGVAKGSLFAGESAQPESGGGVEVEQVVVDGFAQELAEQGDDVPDAAVGQVGGQVPGEGFDVLAGDGVEALGAEGGQDVHTEHAAVTGHGRVGGEVGR